MEPPRSHALKTAGAQQCPTLSSSDFILYFYVWNLNGVLCNKTFQFTHTDTKRLGFCIISSAKLILPDESTVLQMIFHIIGTKTFFNSYFKLLLHIFKTMWNAIRYYLINKNLTLVMITTTYNSI